MHKEYNLHVFLFVSIGRFKRQGIPLDLTSAISCYFPGIKDVACLGSRLNVGSSQSTTNYGPGPSNQQGTHIGYTDGVEVPVLRQYGPAFQGPIGSSTGVNLHQGGADFGTSRGLLGLFNQRQGASVNWNNNGNTGNTGVSGGGRADFLGHLFGRGQATTTPKSFPWDWTNN